MFLKEECELHVQSLLIAAIDTRSAATERQEFGFNRFNVVLDFVRHQAVIDDELNPADGECRVSLDEFRRRLMRIE
jgi:hypothetical protein